MKIKWVVFVVFLFLITACSSMDEQKESVNDDTEGEQKLTVVTTFFPLYDFAATIGGEHVQVNNLVPAGVEPHDWSPGSRDMMNMTSADLFIYNGAGLEGWVDQFIETLEEKNGPYVLEAIQGVPLIEAGEEAHEHDHEEEAHEEEAHEHDHEEEAHEEEAHEHDHEEEAHDDHNHGQYDPHAWLSPLQALHYAENIYNAYITIDPAHKQTYETNYMKLKEELEDLHESYVQMANRATRKEFVVSHEAFGYLARDYGLQQFAVMGLSPDAEPTRQDISDISQMIREKGVKYILFEEFVSPKVAQILADDLNIETMVLHSLEGLTDEQQERGETYVTLMKENLSILQKALEIEE